MFFVYVCDDNGCYDAPIAIKDDVASVAAAIMYYGQQNDLIITDCFDLMVCNTFGNFINQWGGNASFTLEQLKDVLVPMQMSCTVPDDESLFIYQCEDGGDDDI